MFWSFTKMLAEAQQISVRVLHQELAQTGLMFIDPVPAIGGFAEERDARIAQLAHQHIKIIDLDLQIDAAAEGRLPYRR